MPLTTEQVEKVIGALSRAAYYLEEDCHFATCEVVKEALAILTPSDSVIKQNLITNTRCLQH